MRMDPLIAYAFAIAPPRHNDGKPRQPWVSSIVPLRRQVVLLDTGSTNAILSFPISSANRRQ